VAALLDKLIVKPGEAANLAGRDPKDTLGLAGKGESKESLAELLDELRLFQARLWGEGRRSILLVIQGVDASGKDGLIRSIFTGVNPQGCRVVSFKAPTRPELDHDFLWRVHSACPGRGEIGIFNRSHYEDVVTVGVLGLFPEEVWRPRTGHIRAFEQLLVSEGTTVLKCFLHISKEEQKERLEERLADPEKRWKFNPDDLDKRARWDDFAAAYEEAITETSTEWAPWYVIPGDRNWVRNFAVATLLVETLRRLDPQLPQPRFEGVTIT
jgi:PPK2 family polyphosphate:nucleotide phosphotransferase